ncbi:hypothetical protein HBI56_224610 [Parastagonospora nodorum]|nr:hypothetical protein HBH52_187430 [Parastagonospora nodorum]KAH3993978.1 hypothetical protein HBI10_193020 [Parastagonospora nodorum]KAH4008588.1 hypothetical protein HBI13_232880 [Parastagonospora nodorum]KAH4013409.1 hypothetical protein HBI09_217910 [Parastagonospora nodorum]KAH4062736.1 hypothetical protein HBH50_201000 [Parastagonospora nodorum]
MSSNDTTTDASTGATDSSPNSDTLVESTKNKSKPCSCGTTPEPATTDQCDPSNIYFPPERQPYWKTPGVIVGTENDVQHLPNGGWHIKKGKYLLYPDGRIER